MSTVTRSSAVPAKLWLGAFTCRDVAATGEVTVGLARKRPHAAWNAVTPAVGLPKPGGGASGWQTKIRTLNPYMTRIGAVGASSGSHPPREPV